MKIGFFEEPPEFPGISFFFEHMLLTEFKKYCKVLKYNTHKFDIKFIYLYIKLFKKNIFYQFSFILLNFSLTLYGKEPQHSAETNEKRSGMERWKREKIKFKLSNLKIATILYRAYNARYSYDSCDEMLIWVEWELYTALLYHHTTTYVDRNPSTFHSRI